MGGGGRDCKAHSPHSGWEGIHLEDRSRLYLIISTTSNKWPGFSLPAKSLMQFERMLFAF